MCRPDSRDAVKRYGTADGSENVSICVSTAGEEPAVFHRGDTKRTGVRRAFTVCRTAL